MRYFWNIVNKLIVVGLVCFMVYQLLINGASSSLTKNLSLLAIIPIIFIPTLINKLFNYKFSEALIFLYFSFFIVSFVLGSILEFYIKISWFDLFAHFLSGIVCSSLSLIIIKKYNLLNNKNLIFTIIFILSFSSFIASLWEFFEFFSDKLFATDAQWVIKTGIDDTMTDLLISFLSSIVFSIYYYLNMKTNPKQFIKTLEEVI